MKITKKLLSDSAGQRFYIEIDNIPYKVRYRYKKLLCKITKGLKTLRELEVGDTVSNVVSETVLWEGDIHYVLKSIDTE
jgi:hypothetical protein